MTLDVNNTQSKRRKQQRFVLAGGVMEGTAGSIAKPYELAVLKNCWLNKPLGRIVRRDGTSLGTNSGPGSAGTNIPLNMGALVVDSASSAIPQYAYPLVYFSGSPPAFWRQSNNTSWGGVPAVTASIGAQALHTTYTGSMTMTSPGFLFIAQGGLHYWRSLSSDVLSVGIPAPSAAPTWVRGADAAGIQATLNYKWAYTYYNSTTGMESDLSPISTDTGVESAKQKYTLTLPTDSLGSSAFADQKRIYRVLDGGEKFYLVTTIAIATTSYVDKASDDTLTTWFGEIGSKAIPDFKSYIIASYANRVWAVDAANNTRLRYSEPYTDNTNSVMYWPTENAKNFDHPITGLFVAGGQLLVFHPRAISYITGSSEDDFTSNVFREGIGTLYHNSIAGNGTSIVCLSESGWMDILRNDNPRIDAGVQQTMSGLVSTPWTVGPYCSAVWFQPIEQFIFTMGGVQGVVARNRIYGWDPYLNFWHEYTLPSIADNTGYLAPQITGLMSPLPMQWAIMPRARYMYLAFYDPVTATGYLCKLFDCAAADSRDSDGKTGATTFTAKILTQRLDPDPGVAKLFSHLAFPTSYLDPQSATCTLKYLLDYDDPAVRDYSASLVDVPTDATEVKTLPSGRGSWLHLEVTDTTNTKNRILLQEFYLHYRERRRREVR